MLLGIFAWTALAASLWLTIVWQGIEVGLFIWISLVSAMAILALFISTISSKLQGQMGVYTAFISGVGMVVTGATFLL